MSDNPSQAFQFSQALTLIDDAGTTAAPTTPGSGGAAPAAGQRSRRWELLVSTGDAGPVTLTDLTIYFELNGAIYSIGTANGGEVVSVTSAVGYAEPLQDIGGADRFWASATIAGGTATVQLVPVIGNGG